jgi:hypothetical protein
VVPQHEIFQKPFKVDIQYDTVPTPKEYGNRGLKPGDPLQVWHVQTKSFETDKEVDAGLVSMGDGFTDSPDAEYISGGINHKTPTAVAIGRHGPFFLWGFSALPKDMTESGRRAFLNSVVYAAKFDRTPLLVRLNMSSRDRVPWMIGFIANGVSSVTRHFPADIVKRLGTDAAKYTAWYDENRPYMYSRKRFDHEVDEDAKALGIPNSDPRLLDACVAALDRGPDAARAERLLRRYTGEAFATPAEWRAWLAASRADLFFSDVGGYRFFSKAGPDAGHRRAVTAAAADDQKEDNPVALSAVVRPASATVGDTVTVAVRMKIAPGWHTYATAGKGGSAVATRVEDVLPVGAKSAGAWRLPKGLPHEDGSEHYTGDVVFLRTVTLEATQPGPVEIPVTVSFQTCDQERCLPPESRKLTVRLEVSAKPSPGRASR